MKTNEQLNSHDADAALPPCGAAIREALEFVERIVSTMDKAPGYYENELAKFLTIRGALRWQTQNASKLDALIQDSIPPEAWP